MAMMRISSAVWLGWLKCLATGLSRLCLVSPQCSRSLVFKVRLVSPMYWKPHFLTVDQIHHVGGEAVEMVLNGQLLSTGMAGESMMINCTYFPTSRLISSD